MNHPNGEPMTCKCPRGRLHNQQCPWYHPEVINVPDIENTLSTSEQAAQWKIYDTQNGQQESCGCGTAAEIAYLGHKSTCVEFQWIYERSSYEMLLAVLKKRKKVTLFENIPQQHKRPRLQSPSGLGTNEDITKATKTDVNMGNPSTPNYCNKFTCNISWSSPIPFIPKFPTWFNWLTKWWSWLSMWRRWRNATTRRCRHHRTVSYEEKWTFQELKGV